MFREMRRKKQLLSGEDTLAVMNRCTNGGRLLRHWLKSIQKISQKKTNIRK